MPPVSAALASQVPSPPPGLGIYPKKPRGWRALNGSGEPLPRPAKVTEGPLLDLSRQWAVQAAAVN